MTRTLALAAWYLPLVLLAGCGGGGGYGGSSGGTAPLALTTASPLPDATTGVAYSQSFSAYGGRAPYTFAVTAGALPANLALAAGGVLSGTLSAAGTANFTVTVTDSSMPAATASQAYVLNTYNGNALAVTIDSGPLPLSNPTANILYATITVCSPGSTTACQTLDHIQIDTGSFGLRLIGAELNSMAMPVPVLDPTTHNPLFECLVFADGYTWGSVAQLDVQVGGRTIPSVPVHILADAPSGVTAPADCSSGHGSAENATAQFGARGVLGLGEFLQDCPACVNMIVHSAYYTCPANSCTNAMVSLANQVQNPIALLGSDNNGVAIHLPAVASPAAASLTGTLYFGVSTQPDNMVGSAGWIALTGFGEFITNYPSGGTALPHSVIDSGSNAYFFNAAAGDTVLVRCPPITPANPVSNPWAYCPSTSVTPVAETATIQDPTNGTQRPINFSVDNANAVLVSGRAAYPNLAGPNSAPNAPSSSFDWGLPFFLGRPVFVLFEGKTVGATTGPAVAF